jgi:hypothetical protein
MAKDKENDDDDDSLGRSDYNTTSIRVVKFDGKDKGDFREWSMKFQALANKKGFKDAITTKLDVGEPNKASLTKEQKANVKKNAIAWEFMILSTTGTAFLHVAGRSERREPE